MINYQSYAMELLEDVTEDLEDLELLEPLFTKKKTRYYALLSEHITVCFNTLNY